MEIPYNLDSSSSLTRARVLHTRGRVGVPLHTAQCRHTQYVSSARGQIELHSFASMRYIEYVYRHFEAIMDRNLDSYPEPYV